MNRIALVAALAAIAQTAAADDAPFEIHVQMHFAQGWPTTLMEPAMEMGVTQFRDGIYWSRIETTKGTYDYASVEDYLSKAAENDLQPLLVFATPNPLYDDHNTPHTDEGREALARYIGHTLQTFPDQIARFELGNEFNAPNFLRGPFEEDPPAYFAEMAKAVAAEVERVSPETEVICTGAHSVAMGYFEKLFEAGALEVCDAISLHPYRDMPEYVERELARLRALMEEHGRVLPIYVTEFGKWFEDPEEAPDYLMKMAALLGNADIKEAWWYAFRDQEWYPNMGLIREDGSPMPAAATYEFLAKTLLPMGRPRRLSEDPNDHVYSFGPDRGAIVAWGAEAGVSVSGNNLKYFDTSGDEIDPVDQLGDVPFVVTGENLDLELLRDRPVFDSLYQFDAAPWSYHVRVGDKKLIDLGYMDNNWTSFIGHRHLRPIQVKVDTIVSTAFRGVPHWTIERFTAPAGGTYEVSGEWINAKDDRVGAQIRLLHNDTVVSEGVVGEDRWVMEPVTLELAAGDVLDFAVGPNARGRTQVLDRRIVLRGPAD